jgi:hypothetical protein
MAKRTKKQHLVPRFYLEGFKDLGGFVWTYANGNPPIGRKPDATAVETNFYSPLKEDGSRFDGAELLLGEIESAAAPLWEDLKKGRVLDGAERENIAFFVAAQYLRSPSSVNTAAELSAQFFQIVGQFTTQNKEYHETTMDQFDAENGKTTSEEDRERMRQFMSDTDNYQVNVTREAGLPVLGSIESIADHLLNMSWVVGRSYDQHLITSDSPVTRISDPATQSPLRGDGGFRNKTVRVHFPLTPDHMLEMCWGGEERDRVVAIPKQMAREMNRLRAVHAERFVYAKQSDRGIEKLCNKWLSSDIAPRIQTNRQTARVEVKRKL